MNYLPATQCFSVSLLIIEIAFPSLFILFYGSLICEWIRVNWLDTKTKWNDSAKRLIESFVSLLTLWPDIQHLLVSILKQDYGLDTHSGWKPLKTD